MNDKARKAMYAGKRIKLQRYVGSNERTGKNLGYINAQNKNQAKELFNKKYPNESHIGLSYIREAQKDKAFGDQ